MVGHFTMQGQEIATAGPRRRWSGPPSRSSGEVSEASESDTSTSSGCQSRESTVTSPESDTSSDRPVKDKRDETGTVDRACMDISATGLKQECVAERGLVSATQGGSGDG